MPSCAITWRPSSRTPARPTIGASPATSSRRFADVVSQKTGINKQTAVSVATSVLPHIVKFIQSRSQGQEGGEAAPGGGASDSAGDAVGGLLKKLF